MNRVDLKNNLNKVIEVVDELNYLLIVLDYLIDNVDDDELELIGLDILSMLVKYPYDKQKLIQFRKELEKSLVQNDINIESIDNKYIEELPQRIVSNIKNK